MVLIGFSMAIFIFATIIVGTVYIFLETLSCRSFGVHATQLYKFYKFVVGLIYKHKSILPINDHWTKNRRGPSRRGPSVTEEMNFRRLESKLKEDNIKFFRFRYDNEFYFRRKKDYMLFMLKHAINCE